MNCILRLITNFASSKDDSFCLQHKAEVGGFSSCELAVPLYYVVTLTLYKCKKHFIKMLKDVGISMVVPKIKETRL